MYVDDDIVFSSSIEEHLDHLKQIFDRLQRVEIKLQPKKCSLGNLEVVYLGHLASSRGIFPNPERITAVRNFPVSINVKAVWRFLGLASYYIPNFTKLPILYIP